jgi:3-hydroxyacyl-CoA dehydrogenase/enoyl-CoA hydratase/3-hydroxybutyryl-CoA epimerase
MDPIILDPTQDPDQDHTNVLQPQHPHHHIEAPAAFKREIDGDGICWLTFDTPNSAANVWNLATLDQFDAQIEEIHRDSTIRALIIRSAKPRVFVAGADLKNLTTLPPDQVNELLILGQDVFTHLETLRIPKIAMIHGACVGGGYEMALACDIRIASDDDATRIGLPETQLGLIPSWGGSTRLPRLIGVPKALDLIVRGKTLKPQHAKKLGLVDHVLPIENLEAFAKKLALSELPPLAHHRFHPTQLSPLPQILRFYTKTTLRNKYPWMARNPSAPLSAVEVVTRGATRTVEKALAIEQRVMRELINTPSTKRFIETFFRKEAASKKLPSHLAEVRHTPITRAAVIGSGVMGSGIAYTLASRGTRVLLTDTTPDALAVGFTRIRKFLRSGVKSHAISKIQARDLGDRILPTHEQVPLQNQQLIIEAIVEDMAAKKQLLADLARRTAPNTIIASNTSALSITEMAREIPHPERVIGLHFFNPAPLMPLVEVVTHPGNTPEVIATALRYIQSLGKTPILVNDHPGFVVNRILMPYLLGAVALAEQLHDPWDIDDAMLEFGMPMGPLRLLDEIGFDVALHVEQTLRAEHGNRLPTTSLLQRLANAGYLGAKNHQGFYRAHHEKSGPQANPGILKFLNPKAYPPYKEKTDIANHLNQFMQEEAALCLEEGVTATAANIELAMILGTGYPPFRRLLP